jgi:hypothetical protein
MHDPRDEGPLSDAALDRAIEQALAVEPSPAFAARVRSRVASETPLRQRRGWLIAGLAACATPVLLLVGYLALPGGTGTPDLAGRPVGPGLAPVSSGHHRDQPATGVDPEESVAAAPYRGMTPPLARRATRASVPEPVAAARHVIVMPDVVISEAEVSAVLALSGRPVLQGEQLPDDTKHRVDETVDGSAPTALDVAELTIPSLEIEPLELAARIRGESE